MSLRLKGIVIVYLPLKKKYLLEQILINIFSCFLQIFFVNVEHCDKASLPGSPRKKFYRRLSIRQLMTRHFGSNDDLSLHKKWLFAQAHQITKANGGDFSRCHSYEYRVESVCKKMYVGILYFAFSPISSYVNRYLDFFFKTLLQGCFLLQTQKYILLIYRLGLLFMYEFIQYRLYVVIQQQHAQYTNNNDCIFVRLFSLMSFVKLFN